MERGGNGLIMEINNDWEIMEILLRETTATGVLDPLGQMALIMIYLMSINN